MKVNKLVIIALICSLVFLFSGASFLTTKTTNVSPDLITGVSFGVIADNEYQNYQQFGAPEDYSRIDQEYVIPGIPESATGYITIGINPNKIKYKVDMILICVKGDKASVGNMNYNRFFGPYPADTKLAGMNDFQIINGIEKDTGILELKRW